MENLTKFELNRRRRKRLALIAGLTLLFFTALLWGFQGLAWGHAALESPEQLPGFFTDSGQDVGGGAENVVALGDLDGDGDLDAFVRNRIWVNDGYGYFADSGQNLNLPGDLREMALGDVDGDGDVDAIFASGSSDPNQVWLNDGSGSFTNSGQDLGGADSWALATGDVDGDGDLDVLFADGEGHSLWLNDGTGVFTTSEQNLGNSGVRAVALQDLDGDGDLDAFFADCTIWLNDGAGAFTLKSQSLCPSDNVTLAMGDVDGDNDLDAFVGNASGHPNLVWLNDGAANFNDSGQSLGNSSSEQVALGDLDGDGDLDAFVGNTTEAGSDPGDKVWFNDGTGAFSDSGQLLGTYSTYGVALGDVDGDGDLDALVGTRDTPNRLLWNAGTVPPMFYVDGATGSDSGDCRDPAAPCATTSYAISQAVSGGTILVAQGTYTENLTISKPVTLTGGYESAGWTRDLSRYETIIDGSGATGQPVIMIQDGSDGSVLDGLTITGGSSEEAGGVHAGDNDVTIKNCLIRDNFAGGAGSSWAGGGVIGNGQLTILDTRIVDNEVLEGASGVRLGGGGGHLTMINVLVADNRGAEGLHLNAGADLMNVTIANNAAGTGRPGINHNPEAGEPLVLVNSIIYGNGQGDAIHVPDENLIQATYSDIQGGWAGAGNIDADPMFVDPATGDYRLSLGSPAIDTGTNTGVPDHDLDQRPRPLDGDGDGGAVADMGAYEFKLYRIYLPLTLRNFGP